MIRAEHRNEIAGAARGRSGTARACMAFLALLVCAASPALAADGEAGRAKAEQCVACHGPDGNSDIPTVPSLAGQQARYLILALGEFRAGRRQSEQMSQFAASLSDQDIRDLAAYFAAQKLAPSTPPTMPRRWRRPGSWSGRTAASSATAWRSPGKSRSRDSPASRPITCATS